MPLRQQSKFGHAIRSFNRQLSVGNLIDDLLLFLVPAFLDDLRQNWVAFQQQRKDFDSVSHLQVFQGDFGDQAWSHA
jgi:hypothetical protein